MTRLALDRITCVRGGRPLFHGLSFALGAGEALLVQGANGVGKSSLLRIAAGLLKPAAGRVTCDAAVALAAEADALDEEDSLLDALRFWSWLDGSDEAKVLAALDALGLGSLADVPVRLLSTGQRKRATLARLVAGDAPVWLLDEPGNGLDTASLDRWTSVMRGHLAGGGLIVAASHLSIGIEGDVLRL